MKKEEFLEIVKNFSRDDFKEYLYRKINKKRKLMVIIKMNPDRDIKNK